MDGRSRKISLRLHDSSHLLGERIWGSATRLEESEAFSAAGACQQELCDNIMGISAERNNLGVIEALMY